MAPTGDGPITATHRARTWWLRRVVSQMYRKYLLRDTMAGCLSSDETVPAGDGPITAIQMEPLWLVSQPHSQETLIGCSSVHQMLGYLRWNGLEANGLGLMKDQFPVE